MKVSELIFRLEELPQDAFVIVQRSDSNYTAAVGVEKVIYVPDNGEMYEKNCDPDYDISELVEAVVIWSADC